MKVKELELSYRLRISLKSKARPMPILLDKTLLETRFRVVNMILEWLSKDILESSLFSMERIFYENQIIQKIIKFKLMKLRL
jgi:hypothetical protein